VTYSWTSQGPEIGSDGSGSRIDEGVAKNPIARRLGIDIARPVKQATITLRITPVG